MSDKHTVEKKGVGGIFYMKEERTDLAAASKVIIEVKNDNMKTAEDTFKRILKEVKC